jgi:hypothetical protein
MRAAAFLAACSAAAAAAALRDDCFDETLRLPPPELFWLEAAI